MPPKPTAYHRPTTLAEAAALLAQPDTAVLAGGTKLLARPVNKAVVDLQALGLHHIDFSGDALMVGATAPLAALDAFLTANGREGDPTALLRRAIRQAGPNTYRNAATLGGTLASRPADSELLAALLVLDATLELYPDTSLTVNDYIAASTPPAGMITAVFIPWLPGEGDSHRVARTPADTPIVSITGWLPENGSIRLAATGIDERPCRLPAIEAALAATYTPAAIDRAAEAARTRTTHPGDFRGDTAYRAEMAAVLTRRTLLSLNPA